MTTPESAYAPAPPPGRPGPRAASAASAASAAVVDVTDLAGVDESLFLDEDLPDDDELEGLA